MRSTVAGTLFIVLSSAVSARATVLRPMDLAELVAESSVIVHGRVVDVRPEWVRGGRQIDSVVTVEVEAAFLGSPGRRVSFATPGGQIGEYRSIVPGAPEFARGDEVVLFLDSGRDRAYPAVLGLSQGALPVSLDAERRKRVRIPLLVPGLAEAHLPVRVSVTLEELGEQLARVRAAAQRRTGAGGAR